MDEGYELLDDGDEVDSDDMLPEDELLLEPEASSRDEVELASAVRHDENSVRDTEPSPSLSAVANPEPRPGADAASVAVTLPSESLSSCSNEGFFAGSPASAAKASVLATRPVSTADIFIVGSPFRAVEAGRRWNPCRARGAS